MRATLLVLLLQLAIVTSASAQDTLRRVEGSAVTITGTPRPLDSLPIATSYRKLEPTQNTSTTSLESALRTVPGVQIDNRNNYALGDRITIRGIGARSFFGTRGIRVLKDGIPLTFADGQTNLELIDPTQLQSVQALHGPAASIFGNASGGALLIQTLVPPAPGTLARGNATFGSWGSHRFSGALGSVSEELAYGAYITLDSMHGYRDWSGVNTTHMGAQAMYTLEEDLFRVMLDNVSFTAHNPGAIDQRSLDTNRRMAVANNVTKKTGKDGRQAQIGVNWTHLLDGSSIDASGYAITRNITNPTPQQVVELDRNLLGVRLGWSKPRASAQASNEETFAESISFAATLDAQYQTDARIEHSNDSGRAGILQTDQDERIFNIGIGAQTALPLFSDISAAAGLRYDMINFSAKDKFITESNPDESGDVSMSSISPSFGLLYTGIEDLHFFANATQSFETPTSTELANQPDGSGGYNKELLPQKTLSIEFGFRGLIADVHRYNLTFFTASITDALIPFESPGQEGRTFYRNAGEITNKGVEVEIIAEPFQGLTARLGYTYVDSRFTDFITANDTLNGNAQPGVHPHLGALELAYEAPFGLRLSASTKYASTVAVNDKNTMFSPEYTLVDMKVSYPFMLAEMKDHTISMEPYLHVNNLFNRKYVSSFAINAFGNRYYEPAPERSIYAGIEVRL